MHPSRIHARRRRRSAAVPFQRILVTLVASILGACSDSSKVSSPDRPTTATLTKGPKSLPTRGPLLFTADLTGNNRELYSVNEDGTGLRRLTFSGPYDDQAAYSPDGSKIAFVSDRSGRIQLYVMNSDGTGVKQISDFTNDYNVVGSPAWSPDGKKLAMGLTDYTVATPNTDVYLMTASGANYTRLTSTEGIDADPTFSPDGQRIAFASVRDPDGDFDIWTMNVDGTNVARFTNCDPGMKCRQPRWAPDGSKIAFVMASNSGTSVAVWNATTKSPVFTAIGFKDPFWSPDGVRLGVVYNDGVKEHLAAFNATGSEFADVMAFVGADLRAGSWSR